jgi:hypothetical protein
VHALPTTELLHVSYFYTFDLKQEQFRYDPHFFVKSLAAPVLTLASSHPCEKEKRRYFKAVFCAKNFVNNRLKKPTWPEVRGVIVHII